MAPSLAAEAEGVCFAYADRPALDGLSLSVPRGSVFGLLGPNGSGKSTLLSLLAGLRAPGAGTLRVLGEAPSAALRARIGFLFQETSLDPLMTARETLWLHGRLFGVGAAALRRRTGEVLETVGLADRAGSLAGTLSGGMKRRLELARALLPEPELVLLDEPTTGLDPDAQNALWAHLLELRARAGATVVLATNDVGEADRYCERVAFMHGGRVVAEGTPPELKSGLRHDAVWAEGSFDERTLETVRAWPGVGKLTWAPPVLHVTVDSAPAFVPRLFQAAGDSISGIRLREATLEDAYFDMVGQRVTDTREGV
jgi:ABC-2 type transport system ATP-binding protein